MKLPYKILLFYFITILVSCKKEVNPDFVIYSVDPEKEKVELFWKNEEDKPLKSIGNLKTYLKNQNKNVKFAMNGGMFAENNVPKGLYIENFKTLNPIDTLKGEGNFYLQPNGIFYITNLNECKVVSTENFKQNSNIKFATQSGPMLIRNRKINSVFQQKSNNLNIRNELDTEK